MKLTLQTKSLSDALQRVSVATSRSTLPILGNVKLSAQNDRLTLNATDLDLFATEQIEVKVQEEGAISVPYQVFSAFIKRIASAETRLELGKNTLLVSAGEMTAVFETLSAEEFPPNLEIKDSTRLECKSEEILKPLRMVAHAIGVDPTRYVLMGVCLRESKGKSLDFVATNGNLLSIYRSELNGNGLNVIIPDNAVKAILCNITGETCILEIASGAMAIASGTSEIRSKLIEGSYPNYEQVIPKKTSQAFSADRKALMEAFTTASVFLNGALGVNISGKKKELEVSYKDKFKATLLGSELGSQPDLSIRFNARYVRNLLSVMEEETVRIECTDTETAAAFREGSFTGVMLPLREV